MTETFTGSTNAENRQYPRLRLKLWVHYKALRHGEVSAPLESLAQDLGARGLAMRSDRALRVGQLLMLTVYLPPNDKHFSADDLPIFKEADCTPVNVLSRVVWCRPTPEQEYRLGVEFLDPEPAHRYLLKEFLVNYNLDQPDSALYT